MNCYWALPDAEISNRPHVGSFARCSPTWRNPRCAAASSLIAFRCWHGVKWSWTVAVQEPLLLAGHLHIPVSLQLAPNYVDITHKATRTARVIGLARWKSPLSCMSVSLLKCDHRRCTCQLLSQIVVPRCPHVDTICVLGCRSLRSWIQNAQRETAACLKKPRGNITRR